jgi:hypothetical protein
MATLGATPTVFCDLFRVDDDTVTGLGISLSERTTLP